MMKHTPAPWVSEAHCSGKSPDAGCGVIASDDELGISNPSRGIVAWATRHVGQTSAEVEANARLIAAAPDLLDALRSAIVIAAEAREEWDKAPAGMRAGKILIALSGGCKGYRADIDAIHAAIAKVTGE